MKRKNKQANDVKKKAIEIEFDCLYPTSSLKFSLSQKIITFSLIFRPSSLSSSKKMRRELAVGKNIFVNKRNVYSCRIWMVIESRGIKGVQHDLTVRVLYAFASFCFPMKKFLDVLFILDM
jgi:hypothetical protein